MAEEKVALVTGGDSGIGYGISEEFAKKGVNLALLSLNEDNLNKQAQKLSEAYNVDVLPVRVDISKEDEVETAFKKVIDHFGHLDYAVNDAGIAGDHKSFDQLGAQEYDRTMNVDLRGTFLTMNAEIKQYVKQGYHGSVVNISALGVESAKPMMSLYVAAKAGIEGLTHAVAMDYADKGIRVNAVSPGGVRTPMTASAFADTSEGSFGQMLLKTIPMHRVATPNEIGKAVYFLSSDDAAYITGQVLCVDGGASVGSN